MDTRPLFGEVIEMESEVGLCTDMGLFLMSSVTAGHKLFLHHLTSLLNLNCHDLSHKERSTMAALG